MSNSDKLRVMAFPAYASKSNAYNKLLYTAIEEQDIEVIEFYFNKAIFRKPDILHVHWPEFYLNSHYWFKAFVFSCALLFSFFILKLKGTKLIWTIHNLKPHQIRHPKTSKIYWCLYKKMVDGVFSMSDANHKLATDQIPEISNLPYRITYHGLYETQTRNIDKQDARSRLGLPSRASVLLCLGQIKAYKGYENLIHLVQENATNSVEGIEPIYVLVAGKCDEPDYIRSIQSQTRGLNFDIRVGFVSNEDLPYYYKAADVSVIPFNAIFNSGSALMGISQEVKTLIPWTPNFEEYSEILGGGLITFHKLDQTTIKQAILRPNFSLSKVDPKISWANIASKSISLYHELARK